MPKEKNETPSRTIYKKSQELSKDGFTDFPAAQAVAEELSKKYTEPKHRIRTRLRTRTNTWDVVVKVRTEV